MGSVVRAGLLAAHFTVYSYDRRGRGDSGDAGPYAVEREIEDLAAVIQAAGGRAHVWGLSSGAVLALEAAAAGLPITRVAVHEPPLVVDPADWRPPADLLQRVSELIAAGQRGEAVRYFMVDGMGAPAFVPGLLHLMPGVWKRLTAVAHTLPYDAQILAGYQAGRPLPAGQWAAVTTPALVMCGTPKETPPFLCHAAAAVAGALPGRPARGAPRPRPHQETQRHGHRRHPHRVPQRPAARRDRPGPGRRGPRRDHKSHEPENVMNDRAQGPASYFPSIEKKYGQPIGHWLDLINSSELTRHKALVDWLKADYGLGHGHATALVGYALAQRGPAGARPES